MKYLKKNIAFEPLICRWYAWPFLVSPATFSMVAKNRMIPLLESFVEDPDFHRESVKDPALLGGTFIDFSGDVRLAEQLLDKLQDDLREQLAFADAMVLANDLLIRDGNGGTLENLYEQMPKPLRGAVELGYDLNNHPSLRVFESLLYASTLYKPALQSVFLRQVTSDARPFVLTTPHIDTSGGLLVNAPFADEIYDTLAKSREQGLNDDEFRALEMALADRSEGIEHLGDYFTDEAPPRRYERHDGDGIRVRYFGHATLLIEDGTTTIMSDPSVGYEGTAAIDYYSFSDLPDRIDYVVITHNHQDHVLFEILLQLRHKIGTIVVPKCNGGFVQDPSLKLVLEKAGFSSVVELDDLEVLPIPGGTITGLPFLGEHCDLHIRSKLGYQIELRGQRAMCLADSNNLDPVMYERLARLLPNPDLIFIGMECTGGPMSWLYGDLLTRRLRREHDQSRRLNGSNFEKASRIVDQFKPSGVFVYAMGAEPWFTHITSILYNDQSPPIVESNKLIAYCRSRDLASERLFGKREIIVVDHRLQFA
ncbi:MBL fold metallo-hydrolase [Noviherbaspirillum sp.]|uniref:MBL fold metallo-hydrolase n=1 Tax=Noviherbaspirillum sp. TaxID=1926288 RepID=UPI002FDF367D